MSKKVLSRIAAAILTTSIAATGAVLGSSGPANAESHLYKPPVTAPVDPGTDSSPGDSGGLITQKYDTGWG